MSKLKFGGMSFGGKYPHVIIYGKTYKLKFGRSKKKKAYLYEVKKKGRKDFFLKYFYFLFPLYDLFIYFCLYPPKSVTTAVQPVSDTLVKIIPETRLYIPSWVLFTIIILYTFGMYYFMYVLIFKGVKTWHGTEHKVISAAENKDLKNVKKYNPIHERCGGTLIPTMILGYILFMIFFNITGIPYGQMTFITVLVFLNIKFFHKYDKIGIWFGKKFQKYVSVREPENWQLTIGTEGMKELVKAEQNEKFKQTNIVFDVNDIKLNNKRTIKTFIPAIIELSLMFIIVFGIVCAPALPESSYITDKYIEFNGLPGETKSDYVLTQINITEETLNVDRIRVWGIFDAVENQTVNETIYERLNLYVSLNNGTKMFINETESKETVKYWEMLKTNYSFLPLTETTQVNFTFVFRLPEGNYNETCLFNYTPVLRFTSYV